MLFHIGYHKTGTTFLQRHVFEFADCFHRVPQREIFLQVVNPHELEFDSEQVSAYIEQKQAEAQRKGALAVFSNERLSGGPHSGGYDSMEIMRRIKACAPRAKILIFVREQRSMLLSMYAQYVKGVGCMSLQEYCGINDVNHRKELFRPIYLEFDRLVEKYQAQFEQVLVLPFESLRENASTVLEQILSFCDIERDKWPEIALSDQQASNTSRSATLQRLDRFFHPIRSHTIPHVGATYYSQAGRVLAGGMSRVVSALPLGWLDRRLKNKDADFVREFVGTRFVESNQRLSKLINIDLSQYGYY